MINRHTILLGRLDKLANYQAKLSNLMDGVVFGGALPIEIKKGLESQEVRDKLKDKIDRAERIRLRIALDIYNDL